MRTAFIFQRCRWVWCRSAIPRNYNESLNFQYQCKQFQAKPQLLDPWKVLLCFVSTSQWEGKERGGLRKATVEKWRGTARCWNSVGPRTQLVRHWQLWGAAFRGELAHIGTGLRALWPGKSSVSQGVQHVLPRHSCCHPLHPLQDPQCEQQCREVNILLQKPKVPWGVFEASTRVRASICADKVLGFLGPHPNHHPGIHTFSTLLFYMTLLSWLSCWEISPKSVINRLCWYYICNWIGKWKVESDFLALWNTTRCDITQYLHVKRPQVPFPFKKIFLCRISLNFGRMGWGLNRNFVHCKMFGTTINILG